MRKLPPSVLRGARPLTRLLREHDFDLRGLDLAGFRDWLGAQLPTWQRDPVFVQRARIRDLRRAHPELHTLEQEYRRAEVADAATPEACRLRRLDVELLNTGRAVAGLTAALTPAAPEKRATLEEKRAGFHARLVELQTERARLAVSSPYRQVLLRASEALQRLRAAVGLEHEEEELARRLKHQGRRSGHSGAAFEQLARTLTETLLVPELLRHSRSGVPRGRVRILHGVTLGAARTELDQLVIRQPPGGRPTAVLAVIEAKRNLNDLAHGFRLRQENLAWLTGDAGGYDPATYRTGRFKTGHFDRPATHEQDGQTFVFAPGSFCRFRREATGGPFLRRLYFITRTGTLWGVSSAALARIGFRVATDEGWNTDDAGYLEGLLRWCRSLTEPVEAADVIRVYAATPGRAGQVLVTGR
jgi:hypothetical protein